MFSASEDISVDMALSTTPLDLEMVDRIRGFANVQVLGKHVVALHGDRQQRMVLSSEMKLVGVLEQVEGVGGKRINPDASLHGVPLLEQFDAVEHPAEPMELDNPARCPPPENSILQVSLPSLTLSHII